MIENVINGNSAKLKEEFNQKLSESLLEKFSELKKKLVNKSTNKKKFDNDMSAYNDESGDDDDSCNESIMDNNDNPEDVKRAILSTDEFELHNLSNNSNPKVRAHVASNIHTSHGTILQMSKDESEPYVLLSLAQSSKAHKDSLNNILQNPASDGSTKFYANKRLKNNEHIEDFDQLKSYPKDSRDAMFSDDSETLHRLSKHPIPMIRSFVASNKNTPPFILDDLSKDSHHLVSTSIKHRISK